MDKITKSNFLSKGPFLPVYSAKFNELVDEVNAIETGSALDIEYDASVGVTDPMIDLDANVTGVAYTAVDIDVDIVTTALTADAVYGVNVDMTGLAADSDTSVLASFYAEQHCVSTSRANTTGLIVAVDGTRDTADDDIGVLVGFGETMNHASANAYGVKVATTSMTHTNGTFFGLYVTVPHTVTAGTASACELYVDSAEKNNPKYGLLISKDLTNSTAVGALSQTNEALTILQASATSATASGASTVSNTTAYIATTNSTTVASADVYSSVNLGLLYTATTATAGTATNDSTLIYGIYQLAETAGTLTCDSFDVAKFTFQNTGTPVFNAGTYNIMYLYALNTNSPAYTAGSYFNGLNVNLADMLVTDADLALTGVHITVPTAGAAGQSALFASDGVREITLVSNAHAIVATGDILVYGTGVTSGHMLDFEDLAITTGSVIDYIGITTKTSAYLFNGSMTTSTLDATFIADDFSISCDHDGVGADTLRMIRRVWSGDTPNGTANAELELVELAYSGTTGNGAATGGTLMGMYIDIGGTSNGSAINVTGLKVDLSSHTRTSANTVYGLYVDAALNSGYCTSAAYFADSTYSLLICDELAHLATSDNYLIFESPSTTPGAGFNAAGGLKYSPRGMGGVGGLILTEWYINLAAATVSSVATANDIIGEAAGGAAYIGQILNTLMGTLVSMEIICVEVPATGDDDIDFSIATAATGAYDADVTALAGYATIYAPGGAWTVSRVLVASANIPATGEYVYLSSGNGDTAGAYTAGKFILRFYGV
jgi:hypothetical protein